MIEPRYENGAFPAHYDNLGGGGFVEGDSAQYSWMVPHDPAGLFRAMGGRAKAADRLDRFLRKLNAGPGGTHADHALLGNEPTLHVPWLYDWLRQPYGTQAAVRRGLRLYSTVARRLSRQRRPRHALLLVRLRRARPLPRGAGRRPARDRQPAVRPRLGRPGPRPPPDDLRHGTGSRRARARKSTPSPSARAALPTSTACASTATARPALDHLVRALPRRQPRLRARPPPEPQVGQLRRRGAALLRPRPRDAERRLHALTLTPSRNGALWALALLTALGAAMRFASLDVQSYHHDEVITAMRVIPGSFSDMLHAVKGSESNPPLYYVLAWGWAKAFGTHEVGLRSLSALFGTATVPLAYCIGAELAQPPRRPDRRRPRRRQPDADLVLAGGPLLRRCWSSSAPPRCSSSSAPCAPAAAATSPSGRSPRRSRSAATTSPSSPSRSRRSGC